MKDLWHVRRLAGDESGRKMIVHDMAAGAATGEKFSNKVRMLLFGIKRQPSASRCQCQ